MSYTVDIDPENVLAIGVDSVLEKLKKFLSRHFGKDFKFDKTSPFSLQFRFHNDIDVDLLPSPYWETPDQLHRFLEDKAECDQRK